MVEAPAPKDLGSDPYAATFFVEVNGEVAATRVMPRAAFADGVSCRNVDVDGSEGGLFSGSWSATVFASWGVPTLGLAYFGEPGLPADLQQIPLEYFAKAMDWLDAQPAVRSGKTVVAGGSRGGELALLLGATYPRVSAVIADVPSGFVWGDTRGSGAAWTLGGVDLPSVPPAPGAEPAVVAGLESIARATPAALDAATIRVEDIAGPVLLIAGEDDALWPSCEFSKRVLARLETAGHVSAHGDVATCYPAAGHAATSFVGSATTESMWADMGDGLFALGGTAKGIAAANRDADTRRHAFLDRVTK